MRKDSRRMIRRLPGSFGHFDRKCRPVHMGHSSKALIVRQLQLALAANLHLLDWIPITVDDRASWFPCPDVGHHTDPLDILQTSNGLWLIVQIFFWQIEQPEVLPPSSLVFAPMPVEEVGEQPAGVLLVVPLGWHIRNTNKQLRAKRIDALSALIELLRRLSILRREPRHRGPRGLQFGSYRL